MTTFPTGPLNETKVDADLIGGLVVRVGSCMVDTSLRTQLQKLRRSLRAA